jgi:hypothetical protein
MALTSVQRTSALGLIATAAAAAAKKIFLNRWGGTALHLAAIENQIEIARLLLQHSVDVGAKENQCVKLLAQSCLHIQRVFLYPWLDCAFVGF